MLCPKGKLLNRSEFSLPMCMSFVGFEDDIVISYCLSQLVPEEALAADVDESEDMSALFW